MDEGQIAEAAGENILEVLSKKSNLFAIDELQFVKYNLKIVKSANPTPDKLEFLFKVYFLSDPTAIGLVKVKTQKYGTPIEGVFNIGGVTGKMVFTNQPDQ